MTIYIHPTAIVEEGAIIGENCKIGPYCIIGSKVRMGKNNELLSHVSILGQTFIGSHNKIFPFASIGTNAQLQEHKNMQYEQKKQFSIVIGNFNIIRENATIQGPAKICAPTRIGDANRLLANCHIAHDVVIGRGITIGNSVALAGHVRVEDDAYLSGLSAVHQWVAVGALSFVAGGSMVARDVLPFCLAQGNRALIRAHNAVGIQRAGLSADQTLEIKRAVRALLYGRLTIEDLRSNEFEGHVLSTWAKFSAKSKRGLAIRIRKSFQRRDDLVASQNKE